MHPELETEFPIWRAVLEGIPLREVQSWSLDEVRRFNALLDMKADLASANSGWEAVQAERESRRKER